MLVKEMSGLIYFGFLASLHLLPALLIYCACYWACIAFRLWQGQTQEQLVRPQGDLGQGPPGIFRLDSTVEYVIALFAPPRG